MGSFLNLPKQKVKEFFMISRYIMRTISMASYPLNNSFEIVCGTREMLKCARIRHKYVTVHDKLNEIWLIIYVLHSVKIK